MVNSRSPIITPKLLNYTSIYYIAFVLIAMKVHFVIQKPKVWQACDQYWTLVDDTSFRPEQQIYIYEYTAQYIETKMRHFSNKKNICMSNDDNDYITHMPIYSCAFWHNRMKSLQKWSHGKMVATNWILCKIVDVRHRRHFSLTIFLGLLSGILHNNNAIIII